MRSRTVARRSSDPAVSYALALAGAAAFVGQFVFGTHPSFFLPLGIAALPYAAPRHRELAYRVAAVALLLLFIVVVGVRQGSLFLPSLVALVASVSRRASRTPGRRRRR